MAGFFKQFGRRDRCLPQDLKQYDDEYLHYCVEREQVETGLESTLHETDDPEEIMTTTLKTVCAFYGGDWAGIIDIDTDTYIWRPLHWICAEGTEDRTQEWLNDMEDAESVPRWIDSIKNAEPVVLTDISSLRESNPAEYELYRRVQADAVIASPFSPNPTGFLVVRNPTRYLRYPGAMFIFAYVLHRAMAQQYSMEREKIIEEMNPMEPSYDVYINFFGDLQIHTHGGTLTEQIINKPKTVQVIAYILLKPERAHSPREIHEKLYPDETFSGNTNSIRSIIYRFSGMFTQRTGQTSRLIIREGSGYRRNPDLRIMTDIDEFDSCLKSAKAAADSDEKTELLRRAVDLYKGPVLTGDGNLMWLNEITVHYEVRYVKAAEALMHELAERSDYGSVMKYASESLAMYPGNGMLAYWSVLAAYYLSGADAARKEYMRTKENMTEEETEAVKSHLRENRRLQFEKLNGL